MDKLNELPAEERAAILARRKLIVLSFTNFVGRELGKDTETFEGEAIKQVRAVGVVIQIKGTPLRKLIPWSRVVDFEYHQRDPLMWYPNEGSRG